MTIKLLTPRDLTIGGRTVTYPAGALVTLDTATETGLINSKEATATLTGGITYTPPVPSGQPVSLTVIPSSGGVKIYGDGWTAPLQSSIAVATQNALSGANGTALVGMVKINTPFTVGKVAGTVGVKANAALMEITIRAITGTVISGSERREVPEVGSFVFAMPPVTLQPGYYWVDLHCNSATPTFGVEAAYRGFSATAAIPAPTTLGTRTPTLNAPALTLLPPDDYEITKFQEVSTSPHIRVYGVNGVSGANGQPWGWNTTTFRMCYSANYGETWIDMMPIPDLSTGGVLDLIVAGGRIYILLSSGTMYRSSDMTASATWTDITCPVSAGLRRSVATFRVYGMAVWNDYVMLGEYSGNTNLQSDPTDPGGPRILKYGPLSGTPTWTMSRQFTGARHIHSFYTDSSAKLWVSIGDAGFGSDIGVWRMTDITTDNWQQWTNPDSPRTNHYPVDFVEINPGVGCPRGLYMTSDRVGMHILYAKVDGGAGTFNHNIQAWRPNNNTGETCRSMVKHSATGNLYYFTAETADPALYVSAPPYTDVVRLTKAPTFLTRSVIAGGYLFLFNQRWELARFPWQ